MTASKPIPQPNNWAYTIQTNVDENLPAIALEAINGLMVPNHVPMVHHFQLLLYLVLEPPEDADAAPSPLSLLYRLLDIHSAATLAPLVPSLEGKDWLAWPGMAHNLQNTASRRVRARMENCTHRGVWALLFERTEAQVAEEEAKWGQWREEDAADDIEGGGGKKAKTKGSKSKTGVSSFKSSRAASAAASERTRSRSHSAKSNRNSDEEDSGPAFEPVTDRGWLLLEFLVAFWTKDAAEHGGRPHAFLAQLWRPSRTLAFDQADAPLEIIRQAVYETSGADAIVRRRLAAALIKFLVDSASGRDAPFHARSLTTALLPLFRDERVPIFIALLRSSLPSTPDAAPERIISYAALSHFLTHAIEDAAGVRAEREAERHAKRRGKRARTGAPDHFESDDGLAAPTVAYAISLLELCADDPDDDATETRLTTLKLALLAGLAPHVPSPLWDTVTDKRFALVLRVIKVSREKNGNRVQGRAVMLKDRETESMASIATESTIPISRSSTPPSLSLSP